MFLATRDVDLCWYCVILHIGDEGDQDHGKFNSRRCAKISL